MRTQTEPIEARESVTEAPTPWIEQTRALLLELETEYKRRGLAAKYA